MICAHCLFGHSRGGPRCESCGRPIAPGGVAPPLVGRARPLALLDEELQTVVKNRTPRVVAIVGESRMGSSRLLSEFQRRHDNDFNDIAFLRGYAVPGGAAVDPFLPFGRLLRNAFRLDETDPPSAQAEAARSAIDAQDPPSLPDALRALGFFLGLRFEEVLLSEAPADGPDEERRRAFGWFAWCLRKLAARRPLVVLLEGLHDATPEGLDLLAYLHTHLTGVPLLLLVELHRERFDHDPGYFLRFGDGVVALEPLTREQVGELLMRSTDRAQPPPANLIESVMAVTGGAPESVLQVAATLLSHGIISAERGGWGVDGDDAEIVFEFPLTPVDEARRHLATITSDDRVWLRRAASVGMVFRAGALIPLARLEHGQSIGHWVDQPDPDEIDAALERFEALGILHGMSDDGTPSPEREYAFTRPAEQALLQGELGTEERAAMHAVVAEWLEYRPGPERDGHLWQLALHHRLAGNQRRAALSFIKAGERARRRFANELALEAYEQARDLLDTRDALLLMDVLHAVGSLNVLNGAHDRAERAFERMLSLAWSLDHHAKAGAAMNRLGRLYRDRNRFDRAVDLLERGRVLFERAEDGPGVAASLDDLGQVAMRQGERALAMDLFEEALAHRRSAGDDRSIALTLTNLSRLDRDMGLLLTAEIRLREALEIRLRIDDAPGVTASRLALAELIAIKGEHEVAWREVNEALTLARRIGDRGQTARALSLSALLLAEQGALETARNQAEEAAALAEQLGDLGSRLQALRALGMGLSTTEPERALMMLEAAARLARQNDQRLAHGLALRLVGAMHVRLSGVDVHTLAEEVRQRVTAPETAEATQPGEGGIELLIDDALRDESDVPVELDEGARQRLRLAVDMYMDAIGVLESVLPEQEQETINALRELAVLVEALGDRTRARSLERRARTLAGERRERFSQDV